MKPRHILGATLGGAAGGLLNAGLCYLKWPTPVPDADFKWHVMPAGCLHGVVLAALALAASSLGRQLRPSVRWILALPVAWIVGYVAWIPLHVSAFDEPLSHALVWPLRTDSWVWTLLAPVAYFGGVALLVYLWSAYSPPNLRFGTRVIGLSISGVVGSLWFWIDFERWYFSSFHGVIWGVLVSLGLLWVSTRENRSRRATR